MEVHTKLLPKSEWVPNNSLLPLIVYKSAVDPTGDAAQRFEALFQENGWTGIWRNGIFDYQHYHVHAHEVLGIARGKASVQLGGPAGISYAVNAGDCLVLPAGTGHCLVAASDDFLVVGAYPPGQHADIKRSSATEEELTAIKNLPLPPTDPLTGHPGPLLKHWRSPNADQI
ncbi:MULTISPECIES: cupin domain-containing protein [unclassified Rhizobium]|uniref:cupin domain-containing protein n=1 Tax=unclassified Rhizobium TaxID=2613769 RepID=UPI00160AF939|nr:MULTISPECIES: cupin domain-containing protein [unclassified Rhizobium]MBB3319642.1 uncharacterized protein YjlB [Rhizobium sp. BK181]MBB3544554.1 uncharacterized protein YjlB [Rhizobium sp. BK399]